MRFATSEGQYLTGFRTEPEKQRNDTEGRSTELPALAAAARGPDAERGPCFTRQESLPDLNFNYGKRVESRKHTHRNCWPTTSMVTE